MYSQNTLKSFDYFIPTETCLNGEMLMALCSRLRIQIWELALLVPRFIEAQFCTNYYQPAFINYVNRHVLLSVCHESRAIALASGPNAGSLKALTFKPHPLYWARFW
jgi:hypothetical protein